jgi:lipid-binding SYLF domain-containing protein
MKKLLMLSLVALFGAALVRAETTRADLVARVESCEAIFQEFQNRPETAIPARVLQNAKAIIILNQFKAGFFLGVKDGYGVIMVRKPGGRWSLPVLINAGEASLGLQLGANAIESVFIINDETVPRLLFTHRFNIGVDAKAVAGPKAAEAEKVNAQILKTPMLVYSKSTGLYAGATVKAGHISRNDSANFTLYRTKYAMPELLYSDWVSADAAPEVKPLMNLIARYAP